MDITEGLASMRISFQSLRSALDSFCFEFGKSVIINDRDKIAYLVKIFKSQQLHQLDQVNKQLDFCEKEIQSDVRLAKFQQTEDAMETQKLSLKKLTVKNLSLFKENEEMRKEIESLSQCFQLSKHVERKKDDIIAKLKEMLKKSEDFMKEEKIKSKNADLNQSNESRFLKESLQTKENEINNLKKNKEKLEKKVMDSNTEILELKKLLQEKKERIDKSPLDPKESSGLDQEHLESPQNLTDESKNEIKNKEIERKMENKLINTKNNEIVNARVQIQKLKDENKTKDYHLQRDYVLIKSLKNEIINLHTIIRGEIKKRDKFNSDEKAAKKNVNFKVEQRNLKDIIIPINAVSERNYSVSLENPEKDKEEKMEKNDTMESRKDKDENAEKYEERTSYYEHASQSDNTEKMRIKIAGLEMELKKCRSLIKNQNILKSVSEEKIKLLNQFIEDFRIRGE